ncbi:hypothetical protein A0H81_13636 [Grifola frondosa]|uniref:Uncharacterized protein n=1 Tax=Grifola frondosa TaxID=5627 RepID=A0A1C7LP28_GRIFR|nr:hypothetical protein A0H81_13636 [Grifola frondosa]
MKCRSDHFAYRRLTSDYSWEGVTFSVDWLKMIRKEENVLDIPLVDASGPASENTPHLGGDLLATANALRAMRIPLDGAAAPAKDSTEEYVFDWDDEPSPQFQLAPKHRLGVPRGDIKFIVFDLFGTVLDRDRAIRDALSPLKGQFTATEMFELYIESEALRRICSPDAPISELIRSALEDVARHADVAVDEEVLNSTMQQIIRPQLYPDAMPAVNALYMHGYRLIYMSSGDANSIRQVQSPLASKLEISWTMSIASHSPMPDSYASLFEHCAATVPSIKPDQIMVVTSSRYRVVEPASDAGMPSALVQRAENLESKVDFRDNGVPATVTVDGLGSLCEWLGVPLVNG